MVFKGMGNMGLNRGVLGTDNGMLRKKMMMMMMMNVGFGCVY